MKPVLKELTKFTTPWEASKSSFIFAMMSPNEYMIPSQMKLMNLIIQ
jgi:hypothetical protein